MIFRISVKASLYVVKIFWAAQSLILNLQDLACICEGADGPIKLGVLHLYNF